MVGNYTGSQEGEEIWKVPEKGNLSVALKREQVLAAYCNEGGPQAAVRRGPPSSPDARLVLLPRETSLRKHLLQKVSRTAVLSRSLLCSLQDVIFQEFKQTAPKQGLIFHPLTSHHSSHYIKKSFSSD